MNRILLLILLTSFCTSSWSWPSSAKKRSYVYVPHCSNRTIDDCKARVEKAGFNVTTIEEETHTDERGTILKLTPGSGKKALFGSDVKVTISNGQGRKIVPNCRNLTHRQCAFKLKDNSLRGGSTVHIFSNNIEDGMIVSTTPAANTNVKIHSPVTMTISKGKRRDHNNSENNELASLFNKCQKNDSDSCYKVGEAYFWGEDVTQNHDKAFELLLKSANKGHKDAQYRLGQMYESGRGIGKNLKKYVEWTLKSAKQGKVQAQFEMGQIYYKGRGVEKNVKESIKWYKKSALQNDTQSYYNLRSMPSVSKELISEIEQHRDKTTPKKKLEYTSYIHFYVSHSCSMPTSTIEEIQETPLRKRLQKATDASINIRFFESINGKLTGETWPDDKKELYTLAGHRIFKNTEKVSVDCAYGTQVCLGADSEFKKGQWGLGLQGDQTCDSCCYTCPPGGWKKANIEFTCR